MYLGLTGIACVANQLGPNPTEGADTNISAQNLSKAKADLKAARTHYVDKQDWAAQEDQRLETQAHCQLLQARLQQVEILADRL